jgi:hypothetical protein
MSSTQSPPLSDHHHERDISTLVPQWPTAEEARSRGQAPDTSDLSDQRIEIAPRGSDYSAGVRFTSERPSLGRRLFRAVARFFIAVLIGVGGTLAWQSHGDEAKEMIRVWAPSLGWLLPDSTTKSAADGQVSAIASATSPELLQKLESMTSDVAVVRLSLEQLARRQEQMAQNISTLQAVEQDIRQKMISSPPSQAVPIPARKPPKPAAQSSAVQSSSGPLRPPPSQPPLPLR